MHFKDCRELMYVFYDVVVIDALNSEVPLVQ